MKIAHDHQIIKIKLLYFYNRTLFFIFSLVDQEIQRT